MRKQTVFLIGASTLLVLLCIIAGLLFVCNQKNKASDAPAGTVNEYTLVDVRLNNSNSSCWVAYGGRVFDVTRLLARLDAVEAGELLKACGTNVETLPTGIKNTDTLTEYQIGILAP